MKLKKAIFVSSTEAPGRHDKVAFLQSSEPERRDCYVPDLWLGPLGVMAGDDVYPLHMFRRLTVDSTAIEANESPAAAREAFVGAMASDLAGLAAREAAELPKRRGRPPRSRE